jgi:hypothetical protein
MSSSLTGQFLRRAHRDDGTYDSVCLVCCVTVASAAKCESDLDKAEEDHRCEAWMFEPYDQAKSSN